MKRLLAIAVCWMFALTIWSQTIQLDSIYRLAKWHMDNGDINVAYKFVDEYCSIPDTAVNYKYVEMLTCQQNRAIMQGDANEAIRLGYKIIGITRRSQGVNYYDCRPRDVAVALNQLAMLYSNVGEKDSALIYGREAVKIFEKEAYSNKRDTIYANTLSNVAKYLCDRGNPGDSDEAIKLCETALEYSKKGTLGYIIALNNLVVSLSNSQRMADADELGQKLLKEARKVFKDLDKYNLALMLSNHVVRLADVRAYSQALKFADEAHTFFVQTQHSDKLPYAKFVMNHGIIYAALDRYDESLEMLNMALDLFKNIVGEEHEEYYKCLSEILAVYNKKGDMANVEEYKRKMEGWSEMNIAAPKKARIIEADAESQAKQGKTKDAISKYKTVLDIYTQIGDLKSCASTLKKMADCYIQTKEYSVAVYNAKNALTLLRQSQNNGVLLPDVLHTIAMAEYYQEQYDSALLYASEAVGRYKKLEDTLSVVYVKSLSNLALYNYASGDTAKAITIAEDAKEQQLEMLGEGHPDNVAMFYNLSRYYDKVDAKKTQEYYHTALQLQSQVIRNNFTYQTSAEREAFWNAKSYLFKATPALVYLHQDNDTMLIDAYNAQLFMKGLLLNSEINFRKFLEQTHDSVLLAKYNRMELLMRDIDAEYGRPVSERGSRIELLSREAAKLEDELVAECKQFGSFMSGLDGDFTKITSALKDDEIAIELMDLYVKGMGETYMALYLRRGWKAPKCKILFCDEELDRIKIDGRGMDALLTDTAGINKFYRDERYGQLVWGKMLPEMDGVKTVFYTPSGIFHSLGAEYLALEDGATMADKYSFHRLSSTRLVAERAEVSGFRTAAVFGGLEYDMDSVQVMAEYNKLSTEKWQDYEMDVSLFNDFDFMAQNEAQSVFESLAVRGGVSYLVYSAGETNNVIEHLMQNNILTRAFEKKEGIEGAFKRLSGKGQDIIHIATHGFAYSEGYVRERDDVKLLLHDEVGGNPLCRAGLYMSGANYALEGGTLRADIDNGVLTAREISLMDLTGTDLVVLSACRTAAGELRDDGVFGLQRGFKKAGAKTLVMSLWSVADNTTMMLMSDFYKYLMEGLPPTESLKKAQSELRSKADYDQPFFWAPFVILDDI